MIGMAVSHKHIASQRTHSPTPALFPSIPQLSDLRKVITQASYGQCIDSRSCSVTAADI